MIEFNYENRLFGDMRTEEAQLKCIEYIEKYKDTRDVSEAKWLLETGIMGRLSQMKSAVAKHTLGIRYNEEVERLTERLFKYGESN